MKKAGLKNLKQVLKALTDFGEEGEEIIKFTTEAIAREIEADAKARAPLDKGDLRQGIKAEKISDKNWRVKTNATGKAPYSAYMEFGTGGSVNVPEELSGIAATWIGRGVKRINLRPRPYLFPAYQQGRRNYFTQLKREFEALIRST